MKNIYLKIKNIVERTVYKIRHFTLLLLIPASVSAQQDSLECCLNISTTPDLSNPFLIHFCIAACNEENSFEVFWDFGDGSPLLFSMDTCVTHMYPAPAGKFNICIESAMCLPGGLTCEYDTCITLVVTSPQGIMDELTDFRFDVFPNPASGYINVYSESKISSVELLNITGEKIFSCEAKDSYTQIPVNHISTGAYWVKIISANQKPRFKKIQISN